MSGLNLKHEKNEIQWNVKVSINLQARYTSVLPYVLNGDAAVPLLAPDGQGVDQQHDELAVLHADGDHLPVGAVGGALGRMSQTHPVQQFLQQKKTTPEGTPGLRHRSLAPQGPPAILTLSARSHIRMVPSSLAEMKTSLNG